LGALHREFATAGERVNSAFYVTVFSIWGMALSRQSRKNGETNGPCAMTSPFHTTLAGQ
jgi:hypothetical protein